VYTAPGMQALSRLIHDCMPMRVYWKYKPQPAKFKETENKRDLSWREKLLEHWLALIGPTDG